MALLALRRRRGAFAAVLATTVLALGAAAPATASPSTPHVDYVALGDSYTAGTGANFGIGAFPWTFPCIQTPGGYVDAVNSQPGVELAANGACHGALLNTVAQPGNVPSVSDQISFLTATGKLTASTELVSLTAGANDISVNTVLFQCSTATEAACQAAVVGAVKAMPGVAANLVRSLKAIRGAAPNARIVVLGYPRLFDPVGGTPIAPPANQALANKGTALLNATLAASVLTARAVYRVNTQYVDVTARFSGHAANNFAAPWIVFSTVPVLDPFGNPIPDPRNFHPNAFGHAAYAAALAEAVNLPALARS